MSAVQGGSANKIQHATVYAGPNGLTFHVQHGLAKQSQCSVDMPRGLFREYFVGEEEVWLEDSDAEHDQDHDDNNGNTNNNTSQTTSQGGGIGQKEIIQGGEFGVNLTTVLECFSILSKNRDTMTKTNISSGSTGSGSAASHHHNHHGGEYSSLNNVPLCMSYDRGTATFHLEFLEGGISGGGGGGGGGEKNGPTTNIIRGGCLVTCEVPGVAVADDVDDGPDEDVVPSHNNINNTTTHSNANSGLANAFRSSPLLSRAILYSDALQSAVSELYDVPGASVVQVALSNKGIELGTVGPRSEVWVNVPYHRGQSGMYVGLECYKEPSSVPIFGSLATSSSSLTKDGQIVRRYSLSAFLSGMRGLDIGVETCVSVNARGMMAIQHQVSRDGYYDFSEDGGNGGNMRPSFVDFIMVCIEDEEVDGGDDNTMSQVSQDNTVEFRDHNNNGLYDITNSGSADDVDAGRGSRKTAKSRGRGRAKKAAPARDESSSSEDEEEMPARKTSKKDKQEDDFGGNDDNVDFGDEHEYQDNNEAERSSSRNANNAASRILGELEMDQDLLTSRRGVAAPGTQNKKNALEDIRRRRREQMLSRQSQLQKSDGDDGPSGEDDDNNESNESRKGGRKRNSDGSSRASSRKACLNDESEEEDEDSHGLGRKKRSQPQDTQSQSQSEEDEDSGNETEHEDSLDVNAEVPLLFSKRSSLSTSRHGSRRSSSRGPNSSMDHSDNEEEEQEPRMMYGDTKLEFTQDDYDSE